MKWAGFTLALVGGWCVTSDGIFVRLAGVVALITAGWIAGFRSARG